MPVPKEELHQMIEALPEEKRPVLKDFLETLLATTVEDKAWLEADQGDLPPYDWGEEGVPEGKSVRYEPGTGLVVDGGK